MCPDVLFSSLEITTTYFYLLSARLENKIMSMQMLETRKIDIQADSCTTESFF